MSRTILIFGLCMAFLLGLLKWAEYVYFMRDLALEAYIGIIGVMCVLLGGWMGWKLTANKRVHSISELPEDSPAEYDAQNSFGLSPREFEVLELIAKGHSYQEIADKLFLSVETIRTHIRNIYEKLQVRNKKEALKKAGLY